MVAAIAAEHALARPLTAGDIAAFVADGVPPAALSWTPWGQVSMVARERVAATGQVILPAFTISA